MQELSRSHWHGALQFWYRHLSSEKLPVRPLTLRSRSLLRYVIAQLAGAFVGASIVYLLFKGQFDATEDPGTKLGVFCTGPSIPNTGLNILSEAVGTFILVFAIKGIGNVTGLSTGVDKLFVFGIIVSVGMSLGGLTGYAINPARDLGPRLAHAVLPIKGKGDSNFSYGLVVPIVGPIIGAIVAVLLYGAIPW